MFDADHAKSFTRPTVIQEQMHVFYKHLLNVLIFDFAR